MQLTQQKSELISRFEAILEGVENKNIVAALCAKIAEEYHEQQVKSVDLADVVCSYINDNLKISVEKNYEHSGMYGDNFVVSLLLDGQVISKSEFDVERFP